MKMVMEATKKNPRKKQGAFLLQVKSHLNLNINLPSASANCFIFCQNRISITCSASLPFLVLASHLLFCSRRS